MHKESVRNTSNSPPRRCRLWFSVAACITIAAWVYAYHVTESLNPLFQAGALRARFGGDKYQRTVRENRASSALFYLTIAIEETYSAAADSDGCALPVTWDELIQETGKHQGSHLRASLLHAFPMLGRPLDPWGRPWVFRIDQIGRRNDRIDVELTYGSLGPDGKECAAEVANAPNHRKLCDDVIVSKRFWDVPETCVSEPLAVKTNNGAARKFAVPPVLWDPKNVE